MNKFNLLFPKEVARIADLLDDANLSRLMGKRVLITGSSGFLGRYFIDLFAYLNNSYFLEKPVSILGLDNFISSGQLGRQVPSFQHFEFVEHNIINQLDMVDRFDYIIHAAGIASPAHYRKFPIETLDVATIGTKNILELARINQGCRVLVFSSSEIYGDPDSKHIPTPESYRGNVACLGPRACYDMSKRLGETLVYIYHQIYGVPGVIVRPFNVFGPGMQRNDYRVLPNFAARMVDREPLRVYGSTKQTRTFCYITDAMNGFMRALLEGVPGEPYNIGTPGPEIDIYSLAVKVKEMFPMDVVDIHSVEYPDTYPADEPNRRCPDISKAVSQLNYVPVETLDGGLNHFFEWALRHFRER